MSYSIPLLAVFLVLQVLDGVTTYIGLVRYPTDTSEANPVARWLFSRLGIVGALVALKGTSAAIGVAAAFLPGIWGVVPLAVLTVIGVGVVLNNLRALDEA